MLLIRNEKDCLNWVITTYLCNYKEAREIAYRFCDDHINLPMVDNHYHDDDGYTDDYTWCDRRLGGYYELRVSADDNGHITNLRYADTITLEDIHYIVMDDEYIEWRRRQMK